MGKNKGGRPLFEVDYDTLDKLCAIHCKGEECAAILGCQYQTLDYALKRDGHGGFQQYFAIKSANGKMSLRRRQFEQANSGNSTMLIWLGKQWLGQLDRPSDKVTELGPVAKVQIEVVSASSHNSDETPS